MSNTSSEVDFASECGSSRWRTVVLFYFIFPLPFSVQLGTTHCYLQ